MKKFFLAAVILAAAVFSAGAALWPVSGQEIPSPVGAKHVVLIGDTINTHLTP